MNKISCDVIKDLLLLYKDDMCSEKSGEMIEAHLSECADCREYLKALNEELPPVTLTRGGGPPANEDIEVFRKISRRLNRIKAAAILSVIFTIFVISTVIYFVKEYNTNLRLPDRRIAAEDIRITELYQLENGDFYITLESEYPCTIASFGQIESPDGRSYTESYDNGISCLSLERTSKLEHVFLSGLYSKKYSFVIPNQEILNPDAFDLIDSPEGEPDDSQSANPAVIVHKNTRIYYEGKYNEQLPIWEKGQKVRPAPESVEKRVRRQQDMEENENDTSVSNGEMSEYEDNLLIMY